MTLKTTKRWLTFASLFILSAAAGILVWGFRPAEAIDSAETGSPSPAPTGNGLPHTTRLSPKAVPINPTSPASRPNNLAALWDRPLRRPLFDPPPPSPKVAEKKMLPPIRAHLLATMIEPPDSTAVLRLGSGEVVFRKVGQPLGTDEPNVKIARIEAGSVSVSRDGDETRLLVDGQKSR